jgi:hypothetical protein
MQKIKPDPLKHCAACGTLMQRKRINERLEDYGAFQRRVYCNRECMAQGMTKEVCASLSHSRIKAHKSVKARCEMCAATWRLHVHHKDENPHNNAPTNLMTLCPSCHRKAHSPNFGVNCQHCDKPAVKAGLCNSHLTRRRKYGDPTLTKVKMPGGENVLIRSASIRITAVRRG